MTHHHDHDHGHHHHDTKSELTFDEKLIKLLEHWLKHNDDHAKTYMDWAEKAKQNHREDAALLLEEICEMTARISDKFESAADLMKK